MSKRLTNLVPKHYILLARSFVVILGCAAVLWGFIVFPAFRQESSIERIASSVIAGDRFKSEILARQLPIIDSIQKSGYCRPSALRSAAVIRLRMVEAATSQNNRAQADQHLKSLGNAIRSSLSCAPADAFLWLVLDWVEVSRSDNQSEGLKYLRMSYRLGPNEGWIALKRNRVAFAIYRQLPPDLAQDAVNEFIGLIKSKFIEQAAEIFTGPAWPERNLILLNLVRVTDQDRQLFANELYKRGYDVNIPGVASRGTHAPYGP
jgi:hypothetical protein